MGVAATVFLLGICWGLPSRAVDAFLFGNRPPWTGEQIQQLAGDRAAAGQLGADVDVNPLSRAGAQPVVVNDTDARRAEIVRRYRLFTYQPDEMITMMSLASMSPATRDFDPKLYQYGGLWIYPVGGLLKAGSIAHLIQLSPSKAYYLDHPEAFARFYLVARGYVVAWALVGVWAMWWIARRMTGGNWLIATAAAICYALMPAVVNMAHEAKPHLPGTVLMLLAVITATRYVETGRTRWWIITGMLCGAAFGMVLSALLGFVIIPAMTLVRRQSWQRRTLVTIGGVACGFATYFVTNPYVLIHLMGVNREVLTSNLQNSTAMYQAPPSAVGLLNALGLIFDGATPVLAVLGVSTLAMPVPRRGAVAKLLAAAAVLVAGQFVSLATDKPAEYARFALLPDVALCIAADTGVGQLVRGRVTRPLALGALCAVTALWGASYVWHFIRDCGPHSTRMIAADRLREREATTRPGRTLTVIAEPAPYCMPPVNLFDWRIVLSPRDREGRAATDADVALRTVDRVSWPVRRRTMLPDGRAREVWFQPRLLPTPISWAYKPLEVTEHRSADK
jgi:hypothetical protein